jgi:hypothetical protein
LKESTTGSIACFLFILERRKSVSIANNATSARPPRTHPTMIPTLFKLLDVELWAAADPEVPVILPPVDKGLEVDEVVLSGSSVLG